jgi:hypothetical protein
MFYIKTSFCTKTDVFRGGEPTEWVFFDKVIIVTRPWFEFEALVIKLFCDAIY